MKTPILHVRCIKKLLLELKPCRGKNSRGIQGAEVKVMGPYEAPRVLLGVLPSNSRCELSPNMGTMPSFLLVGKSTQVAPEAND